MGKLIGPPILNEDKTYLEAQRIFFVASAPLNRDHHINLSPKSGIEFKVINDNTVAWLDLSGSGAETAAHIFENERLTMMFYSVDGPPRIVRLFGKGVVILPSELLGEPAKHATPYFATTGFRDGQRFTREELLSAFKGHLPGQKDHDFGFRSIIVLHVERMTKSCGYSLPLFDFQGYRTVLKEFSAGKGKEGMVKYRGYKNSFSIDMLPSIGQLEAGKTPSSVELVEGYNFAVYDDSLWKQLWMKCSMVLRTLYYHRGARDVALLCAGGLCAHLYHIKKTK